MHLVLGELLRNTRHILGGPCKDILILTEEVDELAFLFAVKGGPYDSKLLRVRQVQDDLLGFLGRLEGGPGLRVLGVRWYGQLLAGHSHSPVKETLLFGDDEGLGQPGAGIGARERLLVVAGNGYDALGTRHLHLQVRIVRHHHELCHRGPA